MNRIQKLNAYKKHLPVSTSCYVPLYPRCVSCNNEQNVDAQNDVNNKRITNTVRVSSSEYAMNKACSIATKDYISHPSIMPWNQSSDRVYKSGVDVKHNSYQRYLLKKKGLVHLRGDRNGIPNIKSKPINNKWKKDTIVATNYRCSECFTN